MFYIIGIYVVGFIIAMFAPEIYSRYLSLDVSMILKGQVWRIITFILQPPSYSLLFIIFVLYFYYVIGTFLESAWGAFKFNVYYFSGVLLHIIAAFLIYAIFGVSFTMSAYYINLALFMAFAVEQSETKVYLFFLIPVKMKWLGIIDGVMFAITIVGGFLTPVLPHGIWSVFYSIGLLGGSVYECYVNATCALVSMLNFIIFLIITLKGSAKSETQKNFEKAQRTAAKAQKKAMQNKPDITSVNFNVKHSTSDTKHRCAVCGRTENDGEDLVFRYCSKCNGAYEYCNEHLYTHVHVK